MTLEELVHPHLESGVRSGRCFKAHKILYHSTPGSRVIKKKKNQITARACQSEHVRRRLRAYLPNSILPSSPKGCYLPYGYQVLPTVWMQSGATYPSGTGATYPLRAKWDCILPSSPTPHASRLTASDRRGDHENGSYLRLVDGCITQL